jgi:hypothetical protein
MGPTRGVIDSGVMLRLVMRTLLALNLQVAGPPLTPR